MKYFLIFLIAILPNRILAQEPVKNIPEFTFLRSNNAPFTQKDIDKSKSCLFVFFDPECEHCQYAFSKMNKDYKEMEKINLYLVSLADQDKMELFMDKFAPNLKNKTNTILLEDRFHQFILKFVPQKYPSFYLFNKEGIRIAFEDNAKYISNLDKQISKL